MIDKNKILPYSLAIAATAVVVHQAMKEPTVYEKEHTRVVTKNIDKVVYKDRIVVVKEVITKPDGTKEERETREETRSGSETKTDEKRTDDLSVAVRGLPNYSLSVFCNIRDCANPTSYNVLTGFRLGQLPINLELGGGFNGILIGVRYDF